MARLMPNPWFRAQERAYPISMLWEGAKRLRPAPLAEGERALGWLVLPPFQRPAVWTETQQVRFLESLWNHLPVGAYVVNRCEYGGASENWLLDGQQRVSAILAYVADEFPVCGYRWSDLSVGEQRSFGNRTFTCLETELDDIALLAEVYDRLAYGGTPHEPKPSGA